MPRVHLAASRLKRWLNGTHQGGIQPQQLDYYLDEFTFRFNRRKSQAIGLLFHRLVQQALAIEPAPLQGNQRRTNAAVCNQAGVKGIPS